MKSTNWQEPEATVEISEGRVLQLASILVLARAYVRVGTERVNLHADDYDIIKTALRRSTYLRQPPEGDTGEIPTIDKGIGADGVSDPCDDSELRGGDDVPEN